MVNNILLAIIYSDRGKYDTTLYRLLYLPLLALAQAIQAATGISTKHTTDVLS